MSIQCRSSWLFGVIPAIRPPDVVTAFVPLFPEFGCFRCPRASHGVVYTPSHDLHRQQSATLISAMSSYIQKPIDIAARVNRRLTSRSPVACLAFTMHAPLISEWTRRRQMRAFIAPCPC